jgi:hypothetical protein
MKYLIILLLPVLLYAQTFKANNQFKVQGVKFGVGTVEGAAPPVVPPGGGLANGLVSFWNMSEASGTRVDTTGSNDLTDSGVTLSGAGKIGPAADLEATNGDFFSIDDNATLSFSAAQSFTLSAWVNLETDGVYMPIVYKGSALLDPSIEYGIYLVGVDGGTASTARVSIGNGTNASFKVSMVTVSTGTWFFVCGWYNAVTDSIYIQTNDEAPRKAKALYGPYDGANDFMVGYFGSGAYSKLDGLIDLVGVWNRCPTYMDGYAMADSIYNLGSGWQP